MISATVLSEKNFVDHKSLKMRRLLANPTPFKGSIINQSRLIKNYYNVGIRSYSVALQNDILPSSQIHGSFNEISYFGNGLNQMILSLYGITEDLHIWLHGYGKNKGRLKAKKQKKARKKGTKILRGKL